MLLQLGQTSGRQFTVFPVLELQFDKIFVLDVERFTAVAATSTVEYCCIVFLDWIVVITTVTTTTTGSVLELFAFGG